MEPTNKNVIAVVGANKIAGRQPTKFSGGLEYIYRPQGTPTQRHVD